MEPTILKPIPDATTLARLYEFDASAYGDAGISWETFLSWWHAYPNGLYGVWHGENIIGAMGIWPMTEAGYSAVIEGRILERNLSPELHFETDDQPHRRWYVSGIVLRPEHRGTGIVSTLIFSGMHHGSVLAGCRTVDVCAIATTTQGERLLLRMGFAPCGTSADGYEVYEYKDFTLDASA